MLNKILKNICSHRWSIFQAKICPILRNTSGKKKRVCNYIQIWKIFWGFLNCKIVVSFLINLLMMNKSRHSFDMTKNFIIKCPSCAWKSIQITPGFIQWKHWYLTYWTKLMVERTLSWLLYFSSFCLETLNFLNAFLRRHSLLHNITYMRLKCQNVGWCWWMKFDTIYLGI